MRRYLLAFLLLCSTCFAQTIISAPYSMSLNAATATGTGKVFTTQIVNGLQPTIFTMTTAVTGFSAVNVQLMGSVNNVNWYPLLTSTNATGEMLSVSGTAASFLRCDLISATGSGSVTCNLAAAASSSSGSSSSGLPSDWSVLGSGTSELVTLPGSIAAGAIVPSGLTPSTAPLCAPSSTSGAITNVGCASSGGAVSSITTTGTSGPATLGSGVLNIPQYSGGSAAPAPATTGKIIEYWFDEGVGQSVVNHAFPTTPQVANYLPCYISAGKYACEHRGFATWTVAYAQDSPWGETYASDRMTLASGGSNYALFQGTAAPAGTYTFSVWIKATSSTQSFLLMMNGGAVYTTTLTATSTWQLFSMSATSGAGDALSGYIANVASAATDLEVFLPQINSGTQILPFQNRVFDAVLGVDAGTGSDPAWTAYGVNTAGGAKVLVAAASLPKTLTAATIYAVVRSTATENTSGWSPILENTIGWPPTFGLYGESQSGGAPTFIFGSSSSDNRGTTSVQDGRWHLLVGTYDGIASNVWVDGGLISTTGIFPSGVQTPGQTATLSSLVINNMYGGYNWPGDIAYLAIYNNAHTLAQQLAKRDEILGLLVPRGITLPILPLVLCEGDSITAGSTGAPPYASVSQTYCAVGAASVTPAVLVVNRAVSNSQVADISYLGDPTAVFGRATADIALLLSAPRPRLILTILMGANDLGAFTTAAQGQNWYTATLVPYLQYMKANVPGLKIVLATSLPRSNGLSQFNTVRNASNVMIRANASGVADAIMDFAANATMGCDACAANTTYFADGEHPTAAGDALLAPIWKAAVQSVE